MKKIVVILVIGINLIQLMYAQNKEQTELPTNPHAFEKYFDIEQIKLSEQEYSTFLQSQLSKHSLESFEVIRKQKDESNNLCIDFARYINGILVEYDVVGIKISPEGIVQKIGGEYRKIGKLNITPKIPILEAKKEAIYFMGKSFLNWNSKDDLTQNLANQEIACDEGNLRIADANNDMYALVYVFHISIQKPHNYFSVYVDAITGVVLYKKSLLCETNVAGTASTTYSGSKTITTESVSGGGYKLHEALAGGSRIETYNAQSGTALTPLVNFTNSSTTWSSAPYNSTDRIALDIHWGTEKTYDYFKSKHNRNSYDNAYGAVKSYVHYGSSVDNAYWDKTDHVMKYGDGNTIFKPLGSLDVCAHELGHGVNQYSVGTPGAGTGGMNSSGEPKSINEGLSDIWGACVEYNAAPSKKTWLIGEEIMLSSTAIALRSLRNPKETGGPDTYSGTNWGVTDHHNSGIISHWFYLLVNGNYINGGVKDTLNDNGNIFKITGIGITDAAKIVYKAETGGAADYMVPGETFTNARTHTIRAVKALYPTSCPKITAVTKAWYAVGVGVDACGIPTFPTVHTTDRTATGAKFNWNSLPGASSYCVKYKENIASVTAWQTVCGITNNYYNATGLQANKSYVWMVSADCGCFSSSKGFTTLTSIVSTPSNNSQLRMATSEGDPVEIYPNPASSEIFVNVYEVITHAPLKIFNSAGQLVQTEYVDFDGENAVQINTQKLPTGIYTLMVETASRNYVKRFIIE